MEFNSKVKEEFIDEIWREYDLKLRNKIVDFLRKIVVSSNESRGEGVKHFFQSVGNISKVLEDSYTLNDKKMNISDDSSPKKNFKGEKVYPY